MFRASEHVRTPENGIGKALRALQSFIQRVLVHLRTPHCILYSDSQIVN